MPWRRVVLEFMAAEAGRAAEAAVIPEAEAEAGRAEAEGTAEAVRANPEWTACQSQDLRPVSYSTSGTGARGVPPLRIHGGLRIAASFRRFPGRPHPVAACCT